MMFWGTKHLQISVGNQQDKTLPLYKYQLTIIKRLRNGMFEKIPNGFANEEKVASVAKDYQIRWLTLLQ